jgi:hypothetical protein
VVYFLIQPEHKKKGFEYLSGHECSLCVSDCFTLLAIEKSFTHQLTFLNANSVLTLALLTNIFKEDTSQLSSVLAVSLRRITSPYSPTHTFPLHFPSFCVRKSECRSVCLRFFLCFVCLVYSTCWLVACRSTVKVFYQCLQSTLKNAKNGRP